MSINNYKNWREITMPTLSFGYKCQECGRGTVKETVIPEYRTKIKGFPFVVKNARIGVCNNCASQHFAVHETERWERMFEEEYAKYFLTSKEIQDIRKSVGLSMEHFAFLIGCTRQSLYNWERADRKILQSRMADLFLRLVREANKKEEVNILYFLTQEAKKLGVRLQINNIPNSNITNPIVLHTKKASHDNLQTLGPMQMAADTGKEDKSFIELIDADGESVGSLSHNFLTASLEIESKKPFNYDHFLAEVYFNDGQVKKFKIKQKGDSKCLELLPKTQYTEEDVGKIIFEPYNTQIEEPGVNE
jgi:DNA-binding transcriptional regulator YiaG